MPDGLDHTWRRITNWLDAHAPATAVEVRDPVDAAVADAIERDVGVALPRDLRAWWSLTDGVTDGMVLALIPDIHAPLPTAAARDEWQSLVALSAGTSGHADGEAGSLSHRYQKAFVPISTDHCGQVLFADLRPGNWHGCVSEWDHETGFLQPPTWPDIMSMLTDIAYALESGQPARTSFAQRCHATGFTHDPRVWAQVTDGELEWHAAEAST